MYLPRTRLIQRPIGSIARLSISQARQYSTGQAQPDNSVQLPSRWFTDLRTQLKDLSTEKYPRECVDEAQKLYNSSEENWLELLAGQQGFLTEKTWRGIDNHPLLWGDMVSADVPFAICRMSDPNADHV